MTQKSLNQTGKKTPRLINGTEKNPDLLSFVPRFIQEYIEEHTHKMPEAARLLNAQE